MFNKLISYLDLESDIDNFDKIHREIEKDIVFKGTNLWILVFAIIVASVGLNMNSTAVIIGAMLISPLMGPINGMGYSIATYNFPLFKKALNNFLFAVGASLVASTAYFAISPVSTAHSELLARTSPTIYDVLIALFGGLAGIVAISSKHKGNVIPGVAIATALMPPLCTAGYGLATGQFTYFFGAFYLFTINTVFIALSSVAISQLLKFPIRTLVGTQHKMKVNHWITFVIIITIVPSIYFGYQLVQKEKFTESAKKFVKAVGIFEDNYLLNSEIVPEKKNIVLIYAGNQFTANEKAKIRSLASEFNLEEAKLDIRQGFSVEDIQRQSTEAANLKAEIHRLNLLLMEKQQLQDSLQAGNKAGEQLYAEMKSIFPVIVSVALADVVINSDDKENKQPVKLVLVQTGKNILNTRDRERILDWLKSRFRSQKVQIIYNSER